jgi:hypothetical protein
MTSTEQEEQHQHDRCSSQCSTTSSVHQTEPHQRSTEAIPVSQQAATENSGSKPIQQEAHLIKTAAQQLWQQLHQLDSVCQLGRNLQHYRTMDRFMTVHASETTPRLDVVFQQAENGMYTSMEVFRNDIQSVCKQVQAKYGFGSYAFHDAYLIQVRYLCFYRELLRD